MAGDRRDYNVKWAFDTSAQSAYSTPLADGVLLLSAPFKGPDMVQSTPEIITDEEQMGEGHEFLTQQDTEFLDTRLSRNFDMTSFMVGLILAFGMGSVSSALVGPSLTYEHTFQFSDPDIDDHQLPQTTIVEEISTGTKRKIRDLVVSEWTISGGPKERLQIAAEWIGSGHIEASTLTMPATTKGKFLRMSGLQFEIGIAASEVDVSKRIRTFSVSGKNNPKEDDGYATGSGQLRCRLLYGKRTVDFSFVLEVDKANQTLIDQLEAETELSAIITSTGALIETTFFHNIVITLPKLKYRIVNHILEDDKIAYTIEANLFYDNTISGPMEIKVRNTQTDYLV